jgi:hypothetical protein
MSSTSRRLRRNIGRQSIEVALRASGCICRYNVVHTGPARVRIEHDDWCPMIDHGSQLIIGIPPKGCKR